MPALKSRPTLYPDLYPALVIFWDLNETREHDFEGEPRPITFSEMKNYFEMRGINRIKEREWMAAKVRVLDRCYIKFAKDKKPSKKPKVNK